MTVGKLTAWLVWLTDINWSVKTCKATERVTQSFVMVLPPYRLYKICISETGQMGCVSSSAFVHASGELAITERFLLMETHKRSCQLERCGSALQNFLKYHWETGWLHSHKIHYLTIIFFVSFKSNDICSKI